METDEGRGIISFTLEGEWESTDVIEAIEALWPEQIRTGILRVLWDLRGVDAGRVDTGEVREWPLTTSHPDRSCPSPGQQS